MKSNKLCLNKDKTKVMILTQDENLKKNFKMIVQEKTINPPEEYEKSWEIFSMKNWTGLTMSTKKSSLV